MSYHTHFHFGCDNDILSDTAYLPHHLQGMENIDGPTCDGRCLTDGRQTTLCVSINAKNGDCHIAASSILPNLQIKLDNHVILYCIKMLTVL